MTRLLTLGFGFLSGLIGLGYLYRPDVIERVNSFLRDTVLNDSYIALERRKWGVFFLLIAVLLLYIGLAPDIP